MLFAFGGCAEMNDPYYRSTYPPSGYSSHGGYSSGSYSPGYRDRYDSRYDRELREVEYERDRAREERERAEEAREQAERERRRYERERERERERDRVNSGSMRTPTQPPPPPAAPPEERCPSGYSETNRKCTDAERKHGCSDIKMSSGKRCIRM
jgi:chromosome segregation ATPase